MNERNKIDMLEEIYFNQGSMCDITKVNEVVVKFVPLLFEDDLIRLLNMIAESGKRVGMNG